MKTTLQVIIAGKQAAIAKADIRSRVGHTAVADLTIANLDDRFNLQANDDIEIVCGGHRLSFRVHGEPRIHGNGLVAIHTVDRLAIDAPPPLIGRSFQRIISVAEVTQSIGERNIALHEGVRHIESRGFLAAVRTSNELIDALAYELKAVWFRKGDSLHFSNGLPSGVANSAIDLMDDPLDGRYLQPKGMSFPFLGDTVLVEDRHELVSEISIRAYGGHPEVRLKSQPWLRPIRTSVSTDWVSAIIVGKSDVSIQIPVQQANPIQVHGVCLQRNLALVSEHIPISNGDSVLAKVPTNGVMFGLPQVLLMEPMPLPMDLYRVYAKHIEATYGEKSEMVSGASSLVADGVFQIKSNDAVKITTATTVDVRRE